MDLLVALGSSAAYFYSVIVVILCVLDPTYMGMVFFETSSMLITIVLLGRYVENMAKGKTSEALSVLMSLQPANATLLTMDGDTIVSEEEIDVNLVELGDIIKVTRGGKIPVDGVVVKGTTCVDEALVTGESMPVVKHTGSTVIGATINVDAPIHFRVTGVGSDTMLSKIVQMVNEAQTMKAPIQAFADRVARVFVPFVVSLSILTFIVWYILLETGTAPASWRTPSEWHEHVVLMSCLSMCMLCVLLSCLSMCMSRSLLTPIIPL